MRARLSVVLGCGMIGIGAVIGAVARGARVIAVDFGDKTKIALKYGAVAGIDPGTEDVAARVAELTQDDGADVVIEAVGLPATFTQAIDLACFRCRRKTVSDHAKNRCYHESSHGFMR